METFPYEPIDQSLDSLRLLVLLPRQRGENGSGEERSEDGNTDQSDWIRCELKHQTFASKPAYEALSYTWGEAPVFKEITVNGRPFLVRENLYNALYNLRLSTGTRTIWVDAVCINQAEVHERNYQVGLMAFIYARAQRVLVWLGLRPYKLEMVVRKKERPHDVLDISDDPLDYEERYILGRRNSLAIATHPYWTRLWVIQEVILARDVRFHFGDCQFSWEEISDIYNQASTEIVKVAEPIMQLRNQRYTDALLLEIIIETFQEARCTEIRDKIFGFLGIAHDCADDMVKVDYEIGYFDLYAKVLEFQQNRQPIDTPVLNLETDRSARLMKFSQLVQKVLGGKVDHDAKTRVPSEEPKTFYTARGVLAGEILYLGPTYNKMVSSSNANKKWKKTLEEHYLGIQSSELFRLRENDTAYSRISLDWDQTYLQKIRKIDTETLFGYQELVSQDFSIIDRSLLRMEQENPPEVSEPRRFLGTRGLIGFVPPQARVGDLICRFWGCSVAVVLRKRESYLWMIVGRADVSTVGSGDPLTEREDMEAINYIRGDLAVNWVIENWITLRLDIDTLQKLTN